MPDTTATERSSPEAPLATPQTFAGIVRSVALMFGHTPSDEEIGWILWERTGFPEFFMKDPVAECAAQVHQHFMLARHGFQPCACCGRAATAFVCEPCDRDRVWQDDESPYFTPAVTSGDAGAPSVTSGEVGQ